VEAERRRKACRRPNGRADFRVLPGTPNYRLSAAIASARSVAFTLLREESVSRPLAFASLLAIVFYSAAATAQQSSSSAPVPSPATTGEPAAAQQVLDAEEAIAKSDWKAADAILNPWVAAHPQDARALFDAGYVADAENHAGQAADLYRRAIQADPKSFEAHLSLGLILAREGKLDEARTELATATTLDPGAGGPTLKARAWRALAQIDRPRPGRPGDPAEASNDLLQALKLSPETEEDTLLAASLAEDTGQNDAAEAAYRRVLAEDPKSEAATSGLAHLLIAKKQYAEAETLLRGALAKSPGDPALTAQLALALADQGNPEALPLVQKLHQDHPDDTGITRMLAELLAETGQYAASDQLYSGLLKSNPDSEDLLVAHGQNLVEEQKFGVAFSIFKKITDLDPGNADGWSGLAFSASKTGQASIALHALTMRSKFLPENASTYFLWATSYDTLHDKAEAAAYYHHFLESAAGRFPNQEWQARQRLQVLEK
jgi:Flp pilus assembly protein TadD